MRMEVAVDIVRRWLSLIAAALCALGLLTSMPATAQTVPTLSIAAASVVEGNAGANVRLQFTMRLSAPSASEVTYTLSRAGGTATGGTSCTDGVDYVGFSSAVKLGFSPGETSKTLTVFVCEDALFEPDETLELTLSNPVNATILDGTAVVTIANDDPAPPTLSIADARVVEGDSGQSQMTFVVSATGAIPSGASVQVGYSTGGGTATGGTSCTGTLDYLLRSGTLTFDSSTMTRTIAVPVCGDVQSEGTETVNVTLRNPINARIGDGTGVGTIGDNDGDVSGVGTFELSPKDATVDAKDPLTYRFTWTVTDDSWRTLTTMDLRLRNGGEVALWLRWHEGSDTFCLVNGDGSCGKSGTPGDKGQLVEGPTAKLDLGRTLVQGSGPTGPSVTLTLPLSFKNHAAGKAYTVEVAATDDRGRRDDFKPAGTLTVTRGKGK